MRDEEHRGLEEAPAGYRELPPAPELEPWVECFWARAGAAGGSAFRVPPDGYANLLVEPAGGNVLLRVPCVNIEYQRDR